MVGIGLTKKNIKKIIYITILFLLVMLMHCITYAHTADEKGGHNDIMNSILFGTSKPQFNKSNAKNLDTALEYASYICIDQFNGNGEKQLRFLNNTIGVKGIIKDINKINYPNPSEGDTSAHRKFTHLGWENVYSHVVIPKTDIYENDNWNLRKIVLLNTINKVFKFGIMSNSITGYDKKCNALASFIYYIHLIGDYQDMNEKKYSKYKQNSNKDPYMMVLYKKDDKNNILNAIEEDLKVLFSTQENDEHYRRLLSPSISEITKIKNRLVKENNYNDYTKICNDLIEVLSKNVPNLLKNEDFFNKVFN